MKYPVHITLRHIESSPAMEQLIHEEAEGLSHYFDRITDCRVVVEAPHHHRQRGQAYHVHLDLGVPRKRIVAKYEPAAMPQVVHEDDETPQTNGNGNGNGNSETLAQKDAYRAIRGAFSSARRQLVDYVQKMRGEIKEHSLSSRTLGQGHELGEAFS